MKIMTFKFSLTLLLFCLLCKSCSVIDGQETCKNINPFLKNLNTMIKKDPEDVAIHDFKSKNIHFLEVGGYSSSIPGLSYNTSIVKVTKVDFIKGTSDDYCEDDNGALQIKVRQYSTIYNLKMYYLLTNRELYVH